MDRDEYLTKLDEVVELLDRAATIVYNIEGDRFQSAFEQLEDIIRDLTIEIDDQDGQPDEAQEWADFDPEC
jgi:replicative DNA helicase